MRVLLAFVLLFAALAPARAQTAPTADEIRIYAGLHEAAAKGDVAEIEKLVKEASSSNIQDSRSRTPLHVAAYLKKHDAARVLLRLGANPNALEIDRYDIVTIAAVANDLEMLSSRSTAAPAPQHHQPLRRHRADRRRASRPRRRGAMLIAAKAPLNHVNNLGWTALMESIVLGSGGQTPHRHAQGVGRRRR